jgi:hypothetical protein
LRPIRNARQFRDDRVDVIDNLFHPFEIDALGGVSRPVVVLVRAGPEE